MSKEIKPTMKDGRPLHHWTDEEHQALVASCCLVQMLGSRLAGLAAHTPLMRRGAVGLGQDTFDEWMERDYAQMKAARELVAEAAEHLGDCLNGRDACMPMDETSSAGLFELIQKVDSGERLDQC